MFSTTGPVDIFISHALQDKDLVDELENHLSSLKRRGTIRTWYQHCITAGEDWEDAIAHAIDRARVILLLVSASYLASDHCYGRELDQAIKRHESGASKVLPLIVRECDWRGVPFSKLKPLLNGSPIISAPNRDRVWTEAVIEIGRAVEQLLASSYPQEYQLPQPSYKNAATRRLSEQLRDAQNRKNALKNAGQATHEVDNELLTLRRELREGGQLRAGDAFADGRFLLLEAVGRGGYASVWQAYDNITKSQVAVKVLHPNVAGDRIRLERFIRGARIMSTLEHDAIVRILQSSGEDGGYYYYVMDYIPGGSLHKAIVTGRLHPHRAIPIILRVSNALAAAHGKGVTHRDVKPANILLDDAGEPYLTDFDLVKAPDTTGGTRTGGLGTYIYAPPEMLTKPDEADARSDVYGLGMTTIFCLYGRDLPDAMMRRPGAFLRSKLRCDDKLRKVLKKSISLKPAARYANAAEFSEALSRANAVTMDDVFAHVQSEQTKKELSDANPKDELLAQLKAVEGNVEEENRLLRQVQERALQRLIARSSG